MSKYDCSKKVIPTTTADLEEPYHLLQKSFAAQEVHCSCTFDYMFELGSPTAAILYANIWAPRFVELEGLVMLSGCGREPREGLEGIAEMIRHARTKSLAEVKATVDLYNCVDVPFLFRNRDWELKVYKTLSCLIAESWFYRLHGLFPNRAFEVTIVDSSNGMPSIQILQPV